MRLFIFIVIILHGLIHFMGFVKAFNLFEITDLTLAISKPTGVFWLICALLFLISGILVLLRKAWVWMPASIVSIASQILILIVWNDAKFGTIPNVIILIFALFTYASWKFNSQIDQEIDVILSHHDSTLTQIVTEQILEDLPFPVQKWLKSINVVGKESIKIAYFSQKGKMKLKPSQKDWFPSTVEQYVTTEKPGFIWKVHMNMSSLIHVVGRDKFHEGKAAMTIKVGSLFPVVNMFDDDKTNQSTLQRYLMELPWYPTAALNSYITWEEIDDKSAKATMTYKGVTGSATFHFDERGQLLKVSAMRFKDSDENAKLIECVGEVKENRMIDGILIPSKMSITWVLDDGLFNWYQLEINEAKYNFK
ncbi:DUF6544 family protein [Bacillus sp. DNRA2]|uniref:DUF6920 family protein n=1 Tax=Bacillus sp. DNRA2 TaxID=2723053 RepID=UPI001B7D0EE7|nr:DUF6544 family protein [Bacillus sp. DNRA2]